jgi:phosphatidylglycerophosphate synthase
LRRSFVVNRKLWPNLISGTRIALMPAVLTTAIAGSRPWFLGLLAVSLATDALDGFLARRLNAYSELGRKLDSVADYLTMFTGLAGIALLWPEIVRRELPWIVSGLAAFFAVVVYGFVRLGRAPCYHTWASKVLAVACAFSLVPLLSGWSATPFHVAIALQVVAGLEEMVIALILPSHVGEMPSIWHAWRQRREAMALLKPSRRFRGP